MHQASGASNETHLPRAVLRRSAAINDRLQARNARQPDPATPDAPPALDAAAAKDATPPGDAPLVQPPAPPATTPPADSRENDPVYWRHRYKTLEGVLRVERVDRKAEREQHDLEMTRLQEQVRSLQATAKPTAKPDLAKLFTPEQIERFGEEQLSAVASAAQTAAREQAQELIRQEVEPLRDRQKARDVQAAKDRETEYWDKLAELVPDFAEIDASDEWKQWLMEVDEHTEEQRDAALKRHHAALDAGKVAKIFSRYKKHSAPPPVLAPVVTPHGGGTPAGADAPAASSVSSSSIPTDAEIRDFTRRRATIRKGQPGYVTEQESAAFDKRLELKFAANRRRT
jgi:hypothetical protein